MSRKVPQQTLPHPGVRDGLTRDGRRIHDSEGRVIQTHDSISQAKRFMRTGSPHR